MAKVDLFREIPGYAEAAHRENEIRECAFLGEPETVCGVECAPLTLRKYQWLAISKSPFVFDYPAELLAEKPNIKEDIFLFLWVASPDFNPHNKRRMEKRFKQCRKIFKMQIGDALKEIKSYMDESWLDAGEGSSERSFYSVSAAVTNLFNQKYGLPIDSWENGWLRGLIRKLTGQPNPLDIPLKIVWQLMRAQRATDKPDAKFTNRISDAVWQSYLRDLNKDVQKLN